MFFKILLQFLPLLILVTLLGILISGFFMPKPDTVGRIQEYKTVLSSTATNSLQVGDPKLATSLLAFTDFLQKIQDQDYVREHAAKVYAVDAYLNDTLVTHHGATKIKDYFLATANTMSSYQVKIDGISSSGNDHYVRWTMIFSAPKLNDGKPIESVGMSYVRFNQEGEVAMHQDFWDSGLHIYGQLPLLGGMIESIRRRFEK